MSRVGTWNRTMVLYQNQSIEFCDSQATLVEVSSLQLLGEHHIFTKRVEIVQ